MAIVAPTPVTSGPTAPVRNDRTTFSARVDAFVTWLIAAVTQFNSLATNCYNNAVEAFNNAVAAAGSSSSASGAAASASSSASAALVSKDAAAQSLVDMLLLYDQFDDKYLGAKATDPTLDNDGNALQDGAFYVSTSTGYLRAYTVANGWVQGLAAVAGVTSINGLTGSVTLPAPAGATIYLATNFGGF